MTAAAIGRRVRRHHTRIVRERLARLLAWLTAGAVAPMSGRLVDRHVVAECEGLVATAMARFADAGALLYFGIRDAEDLGAPPVWLYLTDDPRWRHGTIALHLPPVLDWIMLGGDRGAGWRRPAEITAADLELAPPDIDA